MILFKNSSLIEKEFSLNLLSIEFEKLKTISNNTSLESIEISLFLFFEFPEIFSNLYLKNDFFKKFFILILESGKEKN